MELKSLYGGAFAGRNVLVTGHTGFKGSWLCLWLTAMGARVSGLALAPEGENSHWEMLGLGKVRDFRIDLRDADAVRRTVGEIAPEIIFHLGAQALVRRSYQSPVDTFATNVTGLVNLLEAVRETESVRALVNATTDKVYLESPRHSGYVESDPLGGHDPYSTSKACAELVTECYRKSFFSSDGRVRTASARAGNVIGGGDWAEARLVPDLVRAASRSEPLVVRHPQAVRPWQHVLEPLSGYLALARALLAGADVEGAWNFGPGREAELPVRDLIARFQSEFPGVAMQVDAGPHPHEAQVLKLECSKARAGLDWTPVWDMDETIRTTARWYRNFRETGRANSSEDLARYARDAASAGQAWARP